MPNRHENSTQYRYSFQGQEKDDEIKGQGNSINYKYRMHDPRIGRFFAVDPLTAKYPHYTPYSFSGNKVINAVELEGLEEQVIYVYNAGKEGSILHRVKWSEIPGNNGDTHGPLGTGTLIYQIEDTDKRFSISDTYLRSFGDIARDADELLKGTHDEGKRERAHAFEDWSLKKFNQSEIENILEAFSPILPTSGEGKGNTVIENLEETGNGESSTHKINPNDSIRVRVFHEDDETGGSSFPVVKVHPKDTSGQKINGDYNEYEGDEIAPIIVPIK